MVAGDSIDASGDALSPSAKMALFDQGFASGCKQSIETERLILEDVVNYRNLRNPFSRSAVKLAIFMVFSIVLPLWASKPEYMKLKFEAGRAYEIKGKWDKDGQALIATDIEILPRRRLPKLRGPIQQIDYRDSTLTMYGVPIIVYKHTEFIVSNGRKENFEALKEGQRIEVSCKFDDEGRWLARKITIGDIKKSDKVKGTITRTAIDGEPPDTLEISGLRIVLVRETDINDPSGSYQTIEKVLFDDPVLVNVPSSEGTLGDRLYPGGDYRQSIEREKEYDLSDLIQSDVYEAQPELRLELAGLWSNSLRTFAQLRMRQRVILDGQRSDDINRKLEVSFTQLYAVMRNIADRGIALQVGRQEFKESREWVYDDYLDAFHFFYYGRQPLVFEAAYVHAVVPLKDKFRNWTDRLGQVRWVFDKHNQLEAYFLSRLDSDTASQREPLWYGFRYCGRYKQAISPWLEISVMRGNKKSQKMKGQALDIGSVFKANGVRFTPSFTVSYASATGDRTGHGPTDYTFRQTGYEDNSDYSGGVTRLRYYGEILDPELSNLKILTCGAGVRPSSLTSVDVIYHSYRQDQPHDDLKGADLIDPPARPNGVSKDIGWELDFVFAVTNLWQRVTMGWTTGIFKPGEAFDPFMKTAVLSRLNLKVEFAI
jgi:alginate production protein